MKRLMLFVLAAMVFAAGGVVAQETASSEPETALKPANFPYQLRGYCLAGSNIPDKEAPGGFYESPNRPKLLKLTEFAPEGILLRAFPGDPVPFAEEFEGMRVVLINGTGKKTAFEASDSRIAIVQEAQDESGEWKPIEYLPSSWCGNSYHRVFLQPREYWEFSAPRYSGSRQTKLRFALRLDDGTTVYSNEFHGAINPEQFSVQQGHTPTDLMDPYTN